MPIDYSVNTSALAGAGASVAGLQQTCQHAAAALAGIALPGEAITVAAELTAFTSVWGDAVAALGTAYGTLGDNLATAAVVYEDAEMSALRAYRRAERTLGGDL